MSKPYKTNVVRYLYNRTELLEQEYLQKSLFNRYHKTDEGDWLELIIAKARKDLINEISKDLLLLLDIIPETE